jgi:hypothetical protein
MKPDQIGAGVNRFLTFDYANKKFFGAAGRIHDFRSLPAGA